MALYTAMEVANSLIDDSDIEAESESDIEEDPDFPLPSLCSDDEDGSPTASPTRGTDMYS